MLRRAVEHEPLSRSRLALLDAYTDDTDAYILEVEWRGAFASVGAAGWLSLVGSFAESATCVRRRRGAAGAEASAPKLQFEVELASLLPTHGSGLIATSR
jgi:hypothetical protein